MGKQYNISALEKRRDWMLILMSQPCPEQGCGAIAGEHCWQVSSALGGFGQRSQRQDFHASRKYAAAQYLEEHPLTTVPVDKEEAVKSLEQQAVENIPSSVEVFGTPLVTPDPLQEIQEGRVPEHIKEMRTPPQVSRTKRNRKNTPTSE